MYNMLYVRKENGVNTVTDTVENCEGLLCTPKQVRHKSNTMTPVENVKRT